MANKPLTQIRKEDVLNDYCIPLLHFATYLHHVPAVRRLIELGVELDDLSFGESTALHLAAQYGYVELVVLLLRAGASANIATQNGVTPFHLAVQYGQVAVVEQLLPYLDHYAVNQVNAYGFTPLHLAIWAGRLPMIEFLIKCNRIGYNFADRSGTTPFNLAVYLGHVAVVDVLLKKIGIGVNLSNDNGFTPLHVAVLAGNDRLVALLLEHFADPNAVTKSGESPLMIAVKKEHISIIQQLIFCDTLDHITLMNGLECAVNERKARMVDVFFEAGVYVSPEIWQAYDWLADEVQHRIRSNTGILPVGFDQCSGVWIIRKALEGNGPEFGFLDVLNHDMPQKLALWFKTASTHYIFFQLALKLVSARLLRENSCSIKLSNQEMLRLYSTNESVLHTLVDRYDNESFEKWRDELSSAPELSGFYDFRQFIRKWSLQFRESWRYERAGFTFFQPRLGGAVGSPTFSPEHVPLPDGHGSDYTGMSEHLSRP